MNKKDNFSRNNLKIPKESFYLCKFKKTRIMLLDILQIALPALFLLIATIVLVRGFLKNQNQALSAFLMKEAEYRKAESERRTIELKKAHKELTLPLRMQAYERMTLFCTRLEITNMLRRSEALTMSARQLSADLLFSIEDEYAHNITQQMYMTDELWQIIQLAKMETVNIIRKVVKDTEAATADSEATASEFIDKLAVYLKENPQVGYVQALSGIKKEVGLLV